MCASWCSVKLKEMKKIMTFDCLNFNFTTMLYFPFANECDDVRKFKLVNFLRSLHFQFPELSVKIN